MNLIINYILRFLLGVNRAGAYSSLIGYTSNPNLFHKYRVVIIPSRFFDPDIYGTPESLPKMPLMEIDDVPFLFGTPRKEWVEDTLVIYPGHGLLSNLGAEKSTNPYLLQAQK